MKAARYLIVGGGISGMMTAWMLAQSGERSIVLLERHVCGREASWAGGGILSPMYPWRYPDAVNALAQLSQPLFEPLAVELAESTGIDPEYFPTGMLMLDSEEREVAQAWCERWGYPLEVLTDRELALFEPRLHTARKLGLWMPSIGSIRNPRLTKALRKALQSKGVDIREHTPVQSLTAADGEVRVRTPGGEVAADRVVVTAGAWSGRLLPELKISPVKGQIIAFAASPGFLRRMIMEGGRYLIPRRDGLVLVGSTVEEAGFDKTPTAAAREALRRFALARYPELEMFAVEYHWAGLRPAGADAVPMIGPHPEMPGVWINAGHFRNGVVTSIASAQLLVDLMLGHPPRLDPAPYRPRL